MALPAEFRIRIEEIRNDFTNGSSVIARNVLKLLSDSVNYIDESNKNVILDIAVELLSAKPHMAAPTNFLKIFINELPKLSTKSEIAKFLKNLESNLHLASEMCIGIAIEKLFKKENTTLLTCSYSSNVFNILARVKTGLTIYILQSIWKGIDYNAIWQAQLNVLNVKCCVLSKDDTIPNIDFALMGADAVLNSGDIINGIPSLYLAQSIKHSRIPLYVVAESFKKCEEILITDGFELIPKELITELITDNISNTYQFD